MKPILIILGLANTLNAFAYSNDIAHLRREFLDGTVPARSSFFGFFGFYKPLECTVFSATDGEDLGKEEKVIRFDPKFNVFWGQTVLEKYTFGPFGMAAYNGNYAETIRMSTDKTRPDLFGTMIIELAFNPKTVQPGEDFYPGEYYRGFPSDARHTGLRAISYSVCTFASIEREREMRDNELYLRVKWAQEQREYEIKQAKEQRERAQERRKIEALLAR